MNQKTAIDVLDQFNVHPLDDSLPMARIIPIVQTFGQVKTMREKSEVMESSFHQFEGQDDWSRFRWIGLFDDGSQSISVLNPKWLQEHDRLDPELELRIESLAREYQTQLWQHEETHRSKITCRIGSSLELHPLP